MTKQSRVYSDSQEHSVRKPNEQPSEPAPIKLGINHSETIKRHLEHLYKLQEYHSVFEISKDNSHNLPFGVIEGEIVRNHKIDVFRTSISVNLGDKPSFDNTEFVTRAGELPKSSVSSAIVEELNRSIDGKFVLQENNYPDRVTVIYTSEQPSKWVNAEIFSCELKNHAKIKSLVASLTQKVTTIESNSNNVNDQPLVREPATDHYIISVSPFKKGSELKSLEYSTNTTESNWTVRYFERLYQVQKLCPRVEIKQEESSKLPYGMLEESMLNNETITKFKTAIGLRIAQNKEQDSVEFTTHVGQIPGSYACTTLVEQLNRTISGKFITCQTKNNLNYDIAFISTKPADWIDAVKIRRELETHAATKTFVASLLSHMPQKFFENDSNSTPQQSTLLAKKIIELAVKYNASNDSE